MSSPPENPLSSSDGDNNRFDLSSCKKVGDGDDVVSEIEFERACERVDDKDICCIVALVDLSTLNHCNHGNKEKAVARADSFISIIKNSDIVAQLINAPTPGLIHFVGECVVHKCVHLWHSRQLDLFSFFLGDEINKSFVLKQILDDLLSFIRRRGKRIAASLLRRKQFAKCKDFLSKSPQAASKLAVEWALDIAHNIHNGVCTYLLRGGKSLLHCCFENTQFNYIGRKHTACLIAYSLQKKLMTMQRLKKNMNKESIQ